MSSIAARLERLPFSRFHFDLLVVGGLGYAFEAMGAIAFLMPALKVQRHLTSVETGVPGSGTSVRFLIGALLAGMLGDRHGRRNVTIAKIGDVRTSGLDSLRILEEAGVRMAYGTDLLGEMHERRREEFRIRARVLPSRDVLASATTVADLVGMGGRLGVVREGALADLIAVRGNPLEDVGLLGNPGDDLMLVMRAGRIVRGADRTAIPRPGGPRTAHGARVPFARGPPPRRRVRR